MTKKRDSKKNFKITYIDTKIEPVGQSCISVKNASRNNIRLKLSKANYVQ